MNTYERPLTPLENAPISWDAPEAFMQGLCVGMCRYLFCLCAVGLGGALQRALGF